MAHRIIAGNDFRLIVCAKRSMGAYLTDMDLSEVDSLRIYMTRAGRSKELQSYTLDENGNAVIYVAAESVAPGLYGIEMVGVYGDASLRAHLTTAFQIVGAGQGDTGVLTDYSVDIVFAINVAASDVFVKASIEAHNTDPEAHQDIREIIALQQNKINAIVAGGADVSLSADPSVVFIGEQTNIILTASCSPEATAITIKKDSAILQEGTGTSLTAADSNVTPSVNITYTAEFVIMGVTRSVTETVKAVHPIYVGAGESSNDASTKLTPKENPTGTYTIPAENGGVYLWILVPGNMPEITNKVTMGGFALELVKTSINKGGVAYNAYRTLTTLDADTHTIVIS